MNIDIQRELTEEQREVVADRLLAEQRQRFDGVRKAAYTAAGVNPATWSRATSGARVRPDRLVLIVKSLWPETMGDWQRVPAAQAGYTKSSYSGPSLWVADMDEPWMPGQASLREYLDESLAEADARFLELEARVRELERMVVELVDPDDSSDPAPTLRVAKEGDIEPGEFE